MARNVINIRVPADLIERMDKIVDAEYTSRTSIMIRGLVMYLEAHEATESLKEMKKALDAMSTPEAIASLSDEDRENLKLIGKVTDLASMSKNELDEKVK